MSLSPLGPRLGRAGFALWSTLAFLPALALAAREAWRVAQAAADGMAAAIAGGLDGVAVDLVPPTMAAGGLPALTEAAGWGCFGWLAALRCRDIGDPPGLGLLAAAPAALALFPDALPGAGALVSLGMLAWSVRLGFVRGRPQPRPRRGTAMSAPLIRR